MCPSIPSSPVVPAFVSPSTPSSVPAARVSEVRIARPRKRNADVLEICDHEWRPVPDWSARYHCARCGAYGRKLDALRPELLTHQKTRPGISPYRCSRAERGRRCTGCGVVPHDGRWFCPFHSGPVVSRPERKDLARSALRAGPLTKVLSVPGDSRAPDWDEIYAP